MNDFSGEHLIHSPKPSVRNSRPSETLPISPDKLGPKPASNDAHESVQKDPEAQVWRDLLELISKTPAKQRLKVAEEIIRSS